MLYTALCLSSYECETADNAQEKERLKYLRRETTPNNNSSSSSNNKVIQNSSTTTSSTAKDKEGLNKSK